MQNKEYSEDEIDLRELFQTIWNSKKFIVIFTFLITLLAIIYVSVKNPTPIYQGKVFVEIGIVQNKERGEVLFDSSSNLGAIVNVKFNVTTKIPTGTSNLLEINLDNTNKETIKNDLQKSVEFILNRHKEKAKFYENIIMTEQIGDIVINNIPINTPKKSLIVIVSFVTGFILSIFLVFFMQFIKSMRKEEK